ncbi:MAG TPA: hypothetical protein VGK19_07025 [Capsulimonadaceae bacterium]|jgi:hypothetical protein
MTNAKLLVTFTRLLRRSWLEGADAASIKLHLSLYRQWADSVARQASPLTEEVPWFTYSAIDFLQRTLMPGMMVFEYGSGGSTMFWAKAGASVVSIEHDEEWSKAVVAAAATRGFDKVDLKLILPVDVGASPGDPADPARYSSSRDEYKTFSFEAYAKAIDAYPDNSFDIVLVDGRARPSCFVHAQSKVKPGGWLILDDAQRESYQRVQREIDSTWARKAFPGLAPSKDQWGTTAMWQKAAG